MNVEDFEDRLREFRPRLHRYCARMTGSAVDGEDVLQDTLIKALQARADGVVVDNLEGWLLRIAHNTSLDFLRRRSRHRVVPLRDDLEDAPLPEADIVAVGFHIFLQLPELQRCAVILKMCSDIRSKKSRILPTARRRLPSRRSSADARRSGNWRIARTICGCR
ncbi:RNA polymerase sigma factor [Sinorhizobium sp. Sb3]|uniref:RNA polymerase sigma factor n=1 Tax=Sinorhizobium sp. Sb3 TaxID=1358417 RepID=UPI00071DF839|nr:RNA polymerase sigma factor [Sinorhizobium sp. Sb3]